jgi:hypothetical protein
VSPYAAGCSVCGADLDTERWDAGPGTAQRAGSWLSALTHGAIPTWVLWVVVALAIAVAYGIFF